MVTGMENKWGRGKIIRNDMRKFEDLKIAVAGTGYAGLSMTALLSRHQFRFGLWRLLSSERYEAVVG